MNGVRLKYGFKAKSERISIYYRNRLKLLPHEYLSALQLADHLGITVYTPTEVGLNEDQANVLTKEGSGWSALTMKTITGDSIIIHNSLHNPARQESNLMHEIAHFICGHEFPAETITFGLRSYDQVMEAEAEWLGSNLQIPREGLVWTIEQCMSIEQIADHFKASLQMVNYRVNISGLKNRVRSVGKESLQTSRL